MRIRIFFFKSNSNLTDPKILSSTLLNSYIDVSYIARNLELTVYISSRYLYGEPVQGVAYVLFGIEINGEKKRLTSMKQLNDVSG